jgi:hypothetical protein
MLARCLQYHVASIHESSFVMKESVKKITTLWLLAVGAAGNGIGKRTQ